MQMNRQYGMQRGGKVTDGLVRIRAKCVLGSSDQNSPKTEEDAVTRERQRKGDRNRTGQRIHTNLGSQTRGGPKDSDSMIISPT